MKDQDLALLIQYAQNGLPVFPCYGFRKGKCACGDISCPSPGKHPLIKNGFYDATTDVEAIKNWFKKFKRCNWGLRTGRASGTLIIDIDVKHGGFDSIRKFRNKHWPPTPMTKTGSGGEHRFYLYPDSHEVPSFQNLFPGVDVRANGGYVVVAPSGRHTVRNYLWLQNLSIFEVPLAPVPEWLLEKILDRPENSSKKRNWKEHTSRVYKEGERHQAILHLSNHLIGKNVAADVAFNLLLAFNEKNCQPPQKADEIFDILSWSVNTFTKRS